MDGRTDSQPDNSFCHPDDLHKYNSISISIRIRWYKQLLRKYKNNKYIAFLSYLRPYILQLSVWKTKFSQLSTAQSIL